MLPMVGEDDLDDIPPEGKKTAWWSPRSRTVDYEGPDHHKVLDAGEGIRQPSSFNMHGPRSHRSRPAMPRAAGAGSLPLQCTPAPPPSKSRANTG